jgi:DNA-binding transcriptional regulator YdaS (Cro superfamily)
MEKDFVKKHFGTKANMARLAGVTRQAVNAWKKIPAERCIAIERNTGGILRCEILNPGIDWATVRRRGMR